MFKLCELFGFCETAECELFQNRYMQVPDILIEWFQHRFQRVSLDF